MRAVITGIALAASITTFAQAQTTSCGMELGRWVCHTRPATGAPDIMRGGLDAYQRSYEQAERMRRDREAHQRQAQTDHFAAEERRLKVREMVARYIDIGRCKEAADLAYAELGSDEGWSAQQACAPD